MTRPATVAVLGPGRIGRQIALAFALGGCPVRLVDVKEGRAGRRGRAHARRRPARDRARPRPHGRGAGDRPGGVGGRARAHRGPRRARRARRAVASCRRRCPSPCHLKREALARLIGVVDADAIVASTSSTISPSAHVRRRGPAGALPRRALAESGPHHPARRRRAGRATAPATVERTLALLERLGKTPVRCGDSPGFIGPRMQVLLMNEAVRLVEEGVATPEDVDRAFRAGMGFRYASIGIFEFIDWGGVDILYRASRFMSEALGDERFKPARLVEEKMARNELGPKTGRGFFDYTGERREAFETEKVRALLRRLAARAAPMILIEHATVLTRRSPSGGSSPTAPCSIDGPRLVQVGPGARRAPAAAAGPRDRRRAAGGDPGLRGHPRAPLRASQPRRSSTTSRWTATCPDWLIPLYSVMTAEDEEHAALLAGIEMIRTGTTTFCEAGTLFDPPAVAAAVERLGMRAMLGRWTWDLEGRSRRGCARRPRGPARERGDARRGERPRGRAARRRGRCCWASAPAPRS